VGQGHPPLDGRCAEYAKSLNVMRDANKSLDVVEDVGIPCASVHPTILIVEFALAVDTVLLKLSLKVFSVG
jgi:hypothetical protein